VGNGGETGERGGEKKSFHELVSSRLHVKAACQ
jgi:hypothetical protein